jgi:hypothetical protein
LSSDTMPWRPEGAAPVAVVVEPTAGVELEPVAVAPAAGVGVVELVAVAPVAGVGVVELVAVAPVAGVGVVAPVAVVAGAEVAAVWSSSFPCSRPP